MLFLLTGSLQKGSFNKQLVDCDLFYCVVSTLNVHILHVYSKEKYQSITINISFFCSGTPYCCKAVLIVFIKYYQSIYKK